MAKLSDNQQASLDALKQAVAQSNGAEYVSRAVWRKHCAKGVSVHGPAMVKTGTVTEVMAGVSTNGRLVELYKPV